MANFAFSSLVKWKEKRSRLQNNIDYKVTYFLYKPLSKQALTWSNQFLDFIISIFEVWLGHFAVVLLSLSRIFIFKFFFILQMKWLQHEVIDSQIFFVETGSAITATNVGLGNDLYPPAGVAGKPVPGWDCKH